MSEIRLSTITDEGLERLVCECRDNAGQAERLHSKPADQDRWRSTQNGWADIYQELLDRRRSAAKGYRHA